MPLGAGAGAGAGTAGGVLLNRGGRAALGETCGAFGEAGPLLPALFGVFRLPLRRPALLA